MFRFVRYLYSNHLLLTNTVTCAGLMGLGDFSQQNIEKGRSLTFANYDYKRTGRMAVMGLVFGPMTHYWYGFLDKLFPLRSGGHVLRKVLLDQVFGAPTFSFTFIFGMALMEGKSKAAGINEFVKKFPFIYLMDWLVWPPSQAINFLFVPPMFRALYIYFIDFCWYTFNSYIKHEDQIRNHPVKDHTPILTLDKDL